MGRAGLGDCMLLLLPAWALSVEVPASVAPAIPGAFARAAAADGALTAPDDFMPDVDRAEADRHWRQAASDFLQVFAAVEAKPIALSDGAELQAAEQHLRADHGAALVQQAGKYERDQGGYECLRSDCNDGQQTDIINKEFVQQDLKSKAVAEMQELIELTDMPEVQKMQKALKDKLGPMVVDFIKKLETLRDSTFMHSKNHLTNWKNSDMKMMVVQKQQRRMVESNLGKAQDTFKSASKDYRRKTDDFKTGWRKMIDGQFHADVGVYGQMVDKLNNQIDKDTQTRIDAFLSFEQQMYDRIEFASETQNKAIQKLNDKSKTDYDAVSKKVDEVIKMGAALTESHEGFTKTIETGNRLINQDQRNLMQEILEKQKTAEEDTKSWSRAAKRTASRQIAKAERNVLGFQASQKKALERVVKEGKIQLSTFKQASDSKIGIIEQDALMTKKISEKELREMDGKLKRLEAALKLEDKLFKSSADKQAEDALKLAMDHKVSAETWYAQAGSAVQEGQQLQQSAEAAAEAARVAAEAKIAAGNKAMQAAGATAITASEGAMGVQYNDAGQKMQSLDNVLESNGQKSSNQMAQSELLGVDQSEQLMRATQYVDEEVRHLNGVVGAFRSASAQAGSAATSAANGQFSGADLSISERFAATKQALAATADEGRQDSAATMAKIDSTDAALLGEASTSFSDAQGVYAADTSLTDAGAMGSQLLSAERGLKRLEEGVHDTQRALSGSQAEEQNQLRAQIEDMDKGAGDSVMAMGAKTKQMQEEAERSTANGVERAQLESHQNLDGLGHTISSGVKTWNADAGSTAAALARGAAATDAVSGALSEDEARADADMNNLDGSISGANDDIATVTASASQHMASTEQSAAAAMNGKVDSASRKFSSMAQSAARDDQLVEDHMALQQSQMAKQLDASLDRVDADQSAQVNTMVYGVSKLEKWAKDCHDSEEASAQKFMNHFTAIQEGVSEAWKEVDHSSLEGKKLIDGQALMVERLLGQTMGSVEGEVKEQLRSRLQKQNDEMSALQKRTDITEEERQEKLQDLQSEAERDIMHVLSKSEKLAPTLAKYQAEQARSKEDTEAWLTSAADNAQELDADRVAQQEQTHGKMKAEGKQVLGQVMGALMAAETLGQQAEDGLRKVAEDNEQGFQSLDGDAEHTFNGIDTEIAVAAGDSKAAQSKMLREGGWAKSLLLRTGKVMNSMETTLSGQVEKLRLNMDEEKARTKRYVESMSNERKQLIRELTEVLGDAGEAGKIVFTNRFTKLDQMDASIDAEVQGLANAGYAGISQAVQDALHPPPMLAAQTGAPADAAATAFGELGASSAVDRAKVERTAAIVDKLLARIQRTFEQDHAQLRAAKDRFGKSQHAVDKGHIAVELDVAHASSSLDAVERGMRRVQDHAAKLDPQRVSAEIARLEALYAPQGKWDRRSLGHLQALEKRAQLDETHRAAAVEEQHALRHLLDQFREIRAA